MTYPAPTTPVTVTKAIPDDLAAELGIATADQDVGSVLSLDQEDALRLVREDYAQFGSPAEDASNTTTLGQKWVRKATATLDFGSIAAGGKAALPVTVAGAKVGEIVGVSRPAGLDAGIVLGGAVTGAGTVTVTAANTTAGAIDPASADYTVAVVNSARK